MLARGHEALWDTRPGPGQWSTPAADSHAEAMWELEDTAADVEAEAVISGLRQPLETSGEFRSRVGREPEKLPGPRIFAPADGPAIAQSDTRLQPEPEAEP